MYQLGGVTLLLVHCAFNIVIKMDRRVFLRHLAITGSVIGGVHNGFSTNSAGKYLSISTNKEPLRAEVIIAGAGLGGIATALALLRNGHRVILTEETDWIGGQLSSQGVPPDEHAWIETHGAPASYRVFRDKVRKYYYDHYPVLDEHRQNPFFNPGGGAVSRLCHEPRVAVAVLESMLAPYISNGKLILLLEYKAVSSKTSDNCVTSLTVQNLRDGSTCIAEAEYFVDATELGDLLPLTGTEFVTGAESKKDTGELHAHKTGDVDNQQAFTTCFAMDYVDGEDFVNRPVDYSFWSQYIPQIQPAWSGKLLALSYSHPQTLEPRKLGFDPTGISTGTELNLWNYRKIVNRHHFRQGFYQGDVTLVNWPQNDYMLGNLIGATEAQFKKHVDASKQLGLSLLYWLQTEAPRPDGKKGWRGLRLRGDIMGTDDGFAKYPYVRESRRIKAEFTVLEGHVGKANRAMIAKSNENPNKAAEFFDSVGIGYYHIDLHPTTKVNYIDFPSLPFQIPLGALLAVRMENIFPANKNIGTTHITNGCYRLHPVEWSIGEAVGLLLTFSKAKNVRPKEVRRDRALLAAFQMFLHDEGIETEWKN